MNDRANASTIAWDHIAQRGITTMHPWPPSFERSSVLHVDVIVDLDVNMNVDCDDCPSP